MPQLFKDPNEPPSSFSNLCRAVTPVSSESLCMRLRGESHIIHPLSKRAKSSEVPLEPYAVHPVTIPSFGLPFLEFSSPENECLFCTHLRSICAEVFERRRYATVPVQWARHPELQEYVHSAVQSLHEWLMQVRCCHNQPSIAPVLVC
jgi:hypothetical protein